MLRTTVISLMILGVFLAGCSTTTTSIHMTGTLQVVSSPAGAEVYLDNEYHGTTPGTVTGVSAGSHMIEIREVGYDRWSAPVMVTSNNTTTVMATLVPVPVTMPVTFATATPVVKNDLPQIHIDGYWTYPSVRSDSNPVPLLVHVDGFNVGAADAREVTVSANLYYQGRQYCWNTIYLGTIRSGGHVTKDTMVSCTLPSGLSDTDLIIKFENVKVTQ
jgi:poly(3-hydroxybutyrate) depolymerase